MRYRSLQLVALCFIILLALPAHALKDYEGGKWEKGFFLGASGGAMIFPDDNGTGISPSGLLGFKIGYDINKFITILYDMSYTFGQTQALPTLTPGVIRAESKCQFFMWDLGIKYSPIYMRFSPYVVADVGIYNLRPLEYEFTNLKSQTNFHGAGGAGLDAYITRRNTLGVEVLYHYLNANNAFSGLSATVVYRFTF